jgi:branched-chain amino acid transport system substrate-binding protein
MEYWCSVILSSPFYGHPKERYLSYDERKMTNYNTLAAQVVQSGAQVVVLGTEDVPSVSAFIKYFRSHHYNPEAIIATSGPDAGDSFLQAIGNGNAKDLTFEDRMAEGIFIPNDGWYPTIKNYQNDTFVQAWLAVNPGQTPDGISSDDVQAFSSAQVLQQAIEATHSIDNSVLKAYMHARHTFKSLEGPVQFDAQGRNILSNPFLFQWQNGHLIPVYPASVAEATPEFPKHAWP